MVDGVPVTHIAAEAFDGAAVRSIYLGRNVDSIASRAFAGAMSLGAVYNPNTQPKSVAIPNNANVNGLATDGANQKLIFYVPEESVGAYKSDYFWGDYSEIIKGYNP